MATDTAGAAPLGLATDTTMATGSFTSDANATSLTLGFTPRYVKVVDGTNNIVWEKLQGLPSNTTIKNVAAGTQTLDTTSAITIGNDAGLNEPGSSVLLSAALCGSGALIVWAALG